MAVWLAGWLSVGWVVGLGCRVHLSVHEACELARAIRRRVLIAGGVKRHPFEIRIGDGGVSGKTVRRLRVERVRVCAGSRVQ